MESTYPIAELIFFNCLLCVCVYGVGATMTMWRSEANVLKSVLSSSHLSVVSRYQAQVRLEHGTFTSCSQKEKSILDFDGLKCG